MAAEQCLLDFEGKESRPPELLESLAREQELEMSSVHAADELMELTNRRFPACLVLSTVGDPEAVIEVGKHMKADLFSAIMPVGLLVYNHSGDLPPAGLLSGRDNP